MKFCFVFICQKGELEVKSMLLAVSLVENLRCNYELVAAIPHPKSIWGTISEPTERLIKELGIRKVEIKNQIDLNYPIANKLSCLGINTDANKIVFLDSDILCLREFNPENFFINQFNAKPADMETFGNWKPVYDLFNMSLPMEKVIATSSKKEMYPYFNAGMISIDNNKEFSHEWIKCCKRIDDSENILNKRPWLDQIGLPIVLKTLNWNYGVIDERFNFPAHHKKMPKELPFLCHYHFPHIIQNENRLLDFVDELANKYPLLKIISKNFTEWKFISENNTMRLKNEIWNETLNKGKLVYSSLEKYIIKKIWLSRPNSNENKNIIITGIPRSGTSYFCKLMFSIDNSVVINEPHDLFGLLAKSSSLNPLSEYYKKLRYKISKGKKISNKVYNGEIIEDTAKNDTRIPFKHHITNKNFLLSVKNTLAFLSVLPFIKQEMPKSKIVVCIRNPIDTIASWKKSFPHLSDVIFNSFPRVFFNPYFRNQWQKEALTEITLSEDFDIKRALLWNYLAEIIERNKGEIILIKYEDFVENPNQEFKKVLSEYPELKFDLPASEIRSSKNSMSLEEIDKIKNICRLPALKFGYDL